MICVPPSKVADRSDSILDVTKFPFIATISGDGRRTTMMRVERKGSKLVTTAICSGPVLPTPAPRRHPHDQNVQLALAI